MCVLLRVSLVVDHENIRVLSELEVLLPLCWSTNTRHVLLHLPDFMRRCGPFHTHSMLSFERWHTVLKKLAASTHHVMSSIRNHYNMLFCANEWQLSSGGGDNWAKHPHRSTLYGHLQSPPGGYHEFTYQPSKGYSADDLDSSPRGSFVQVQDQWAVVNKTFDQLRDRYRRGQKEYARSRNQWLRTCPVMDSQWRPREASSDRRRTKNADNDDIGE